MNLNVACSLVVFPPVATAAAAAVVIAFVAAQLGSTPARVSAAQIDAMATSRTVEAAKVSATGPAVSVAAHLIAEHFVFRLEMLNVLVYRMCVMVMFDVNWNMN